MENMSKFLLIAGGIFVAILTVSVFYFVFGRISEFKEITETDYSAEELSDFNQGFLSYNKKLMYGADVLTVINKAVDNNKKYNLMKKKIDGSWEIDSDNDYFVNVNVSLKKSLCIRTETYIVDKDITELHSDFQYKYTKTDEREKTILKDATIGNYNNNTNFSILVNYQEIKNILIDGGKIYYEKDDGTSTNGNQEKNAYQRILETTTINGKKVPTRYEMIYYPTAEFKRKTFQCTDVKENSSGRVCSMTFSEI